MSDFDHTKRVALKPETRAYLRDWLAWVERGAPQGEPYYRFSGLCDNIDEFTSDTNVQKVLDYDLYCVAFGGLTFPFGEDAYRQRGCPEDDGTQHEDPKRLEWVRINAPDEEPTP